MGGALWWERQRDNLFRVRYGVYAAGTGANNVPVGSSGRATLVGSAGTYMRGETTGSGAADSLVAGAGAEVLAVGSGADTLAGSTTGTDTFNFLNEVAGQTYTITGFLTATIFTSLV